MDGARRPTRCGSASFWLNSIFRASRTAVGLDPTTRRYELSGRAHYTMLDQVVARSTALAALVVRTGAGLDLDWSIAVQASRPLVVDAFAVRA